jgi:hypothetical protein
VITEFVIGTLATWRVASLLTREEGPFALFSRLRGSDSERGPRRPLHCLYCTSLWVAAPIAGFVAPWSWRSIVIWLALSGGACLLDRATAHGLEIAPLPDRQLPPGE